MPQIASLIDIYKYLNFSGRSKCMNWHWTEVSHLKYILEFSSL